MHLDPIHAMRAASGLILSSVALSGLLKQPQAVEVPAPTPQVAATPAAASVPEIARFIELEPPKPTPTCPCSGECTCGCQDGQPCRCGSLKAKDPPKQEPQYTSGRDWRIKGQPWTRQSLLTHLYGSDGNHYHPPGSLDHLSLSELQAMHNDEHDHGTARSQPKTVVRSVQSGCPDGYCPAPTTRTRRFR